MPLLAACGKDAPDLEPVAELAPLAAWGEVTVDPAHVDLGHPSAVHLQLDGWREGPDDATGDALWAVGERSTLRIPRLQATARELRLRGRPFVFDGAPPQFVTVRLGGTMLGRHEVGPGLTEIRIPTRNEQWRRGDNLLELEHAWHRSPREVGRGRDARELAAAWYDLELVAPGAGGAASNPPPPRAEDGRIFLPWGTGLDLYVHLPDRAALEAERWAWRGGREDSREDDAGAASGGTLAVEVQPAGQATREVARLHAPPPGPLVLIGDGGLARLGFSALPPAAGSTDGGVLLTAPRILAPSEVVGAPGHGETPTAGATEPVEGRTGAPPVPVPPALVVFLVDTLRADHLGPWGGDHVATPAIDAFAEDAVVFDHLIAQSPWTRASVGSIFTGAWPPAHGAITRDGRRLADGLPTLASLLRDAGWQTMAFVDNPNVSATFGFDRGFEGYVEPEGDLQALEMNERVGRWLAERADQRPLFLYVHTLEPHSPYDPPDFWRRRVAPEISAELGDGSLEKLNAIRAGRIMPDPELLANLHALYHAEVSFADHAFGDFLGILEQNGLGDAAVLFLSDHGEEFLEHGNLEHGRALHAESLHVPAILRWPGVAPRRVEEPTQHLDILPTILGRLGIDPPPGLSGEDVLAPGRGQHGERPIYSHLNLGGPERVSLRQGRWKLIQEIAGSGETLGWKLYDVEADPAEIRLLNDEYPVRRGWLATLLRRQMATGGRVDSSETEIDPELRKSLEALGYL